MTLHIYYFVFCDSFLFKASQTWLFHLVVKHCSPWQVPTMEQGKTCTGGDS